MNYEALALVVSLVVPAVGWAIHVSVQLSRLRTSIQYTNSNLALIDWEKVPRKNLNNVIGGKSC